MTRRISPTSTAIAAGLQVPRLRPVIVRWLREEYESAGRNQSQLARNLQVGARTVRQWFADPTLRAELDDWSDVRLQISISAAGSRQQQILDGELPWTDPAATRLLERIRRRLDASGHRDVDVFAVDGRLKLVRGESVAWH